MAIKHQLEATPITLDSREDQLTASTLSDYAPVSYVGEMLEAGDVCGVLRRRRMEGR